MLFLAMFFWPISVPLLAGYVYLLYRTIKKRAFVALAIVALSPFIAYKAFQSYWYLQVLPEQIAVSYPVSINEEAFFMEGCSVAVYKLSGWTLESVQKQGAAFFAGATQARGYPDERYYTFAEWSETPVPATWTGEGSWMMCPGMGDALHSQIVEAAQRKGAFYTTKDEGQLIVIPSLGIVIFSSWG
jgi:hypothetical protein